MKYWISWYHSKKYSAFEMTRPWFITGWRCSDDANTVCAALIADSEQTAIEQIYQSYDERPSNIEIRFCEVKPDEWSPFEGGRFVRKDWMEWPQDAGEESR